MDKQTELMIITMEECGELTQACSKVLRTDFRKESVEDLSKEVADVMCMIEIMKDQGLIKHSDIVQGIQNKRTKLKIWSNLIVGS
jgi:NTP pyrophosphatase (non-canonical NTP hydrolase)